MAVTSLASKIEGNLKVKSGPSTTITLSSKSFAKEAGQEMRAGRPVKFEKYILWHEIERNSNKAHSSMNQSALNPFDERPKCQSIAEARSKLKDLQIERP